MNLYGIAIGINFHARSQKDAEAFVEELQTMLRGMEDGPCSVDSVELSGEVEELE
jgi:hypothetical protein